MEFCRTNSQEIHLSPEESGSDMSVCSEYQVYFTLVVVRMNGIYINTVNQYFNRPTAALDLQYHYFICQGLGSHIFNKYHSTRCSSPSP